MNKGRKISGGKYHAHRKQKLYERQPQERSVVMDKDTKRKITTVRGGNPKVILLRTNQVNVLVSKGKTQKAEIINVEETPQNRFFARENRLVKGAIIETNLGKAKITNRPSQEGMVNASLMAKK